MKRMSLDEINNMIPQLHEVQLDLLVQLDRVCKENGIRYYLAFGSCLGALRHKGFIPWDHDIDVLMSIDDVEKFEKCLRSEKYKLLTWKNGSNFNSIAPWFINKDTTCVIEENINLDIDQAVAIDIYPFYNAPSSKIGLLLNIWRAHLYTLLVLNSPPQNHGGAIKSIGKAILFFYRKNRIEKAIKLEKKLRSVPKGKRILDYFGLDIGLFSAITYDAEWFEKPSDLEFEGKVFMGPTNPDKYLTQRYGNYMELPPIEKRLSNLSNYVYLDLEKGYHGKWK